MRAAPAITEQRGAPDHEHGVHGARHEDQEDLLVDRVRGADRVGGQVGGREGVGAVVGRDVVAHFWRFGWGGLAWR